ncbi:MAG: DNA mismatch repair protein MutS [Pirellulaceae bacterium]|nr:DNA mismatch repair protein MutS [Pirellulaceae bacterium]
MTVTPMMQQYYQAKSSAGEAILLFRMGDFYELFGDDAKIGARILGLTLTSRDKKGDNPLPMAGFPHHQLDTYLAKLIHAGHRAAVCDQIENPKEAKGIVQREITRVVTPGTLLEETLLDPKESNYLAAVVTSSGKGDSCQSHERVGFAWIELSTGQFQAMAVSASNLGDQLARIQPAECIISEDETIFSDNQEWKAIQTKRQAWEFGEKQSFETLTKHFKTKNLEGFGFDAKEDQLPLRAAGAILSYLQETQKNSLSHIRQISYYQSGKTLEIDRATRRSLELTKTIRENQRDGSLLSVLDRTVTPMGSRLLADWLTNPLTEKESILERHETIQELLKRESLCQKGQQFLKETYDLQRLVSRVTTGRASPRDLSCIGKTLLQLPKLKELLIGAASPLLKKLDSDLEHFPELCQKLESALADPAPLVSREGGVLRSGYNNELDELLALARGGKDWIASYQAQLAKELEIPSLKVGYNRVFGYYLELTNLHREKAPDYFIRKQTLKNAERYITPELKEYEEKVLSASEKANELEYELFQQLRQEVWQVCESLTNTATALAKLDVLFSLTQTALHQGYCCPEIVDEPILEIHEGRHPVLDITEPEGTFVPNSTMATDSDGKILLITGPNMAGKSTYIRQVALITIMAQMGSFVPAERACIGLTDKVFARVGASDELSKGQSTFMVEMTETARILNTATKHSLVILDEIGRGTSTYDGLSLAWSIVEYLHDKIGCRTLFATHYHELTDLEKSLSLVSNLNVQVKEWDDQVLFLHKIVTGSANKSYGIHVARLAGIPDQVNERARQILLQLEAEHIQQLESVSVRSSENPSSMNRRRNDRAHVREGSAATEVSPSERPIVEPHSAPATVAQNNLGKEGLQLSLFEAAEHPLLEKIREAKVENLTPLEALLLINKWKEEL